MQLTNRQAGHIRQALAVLTANLLLVTGAHAQGTTNDAQSDLGTTKVDSAVLFYQESGGRVRAIEPVTSLDITDLDGDVVSLKATFDSLTGATPNGAAPWKGVQTFTTPAAKAGTTATVTGASGRSTLVTLPGGLVTRQYTTAANTLPVDSGFKDHRFALDAGFSYQLDANTKLLSGLAGSFETDYRSFTVSGGVARDFNHKNTTLSLSGSIEFDQSRPYYGTPTAFAVMDGTAKGPNASKKVYGLGLGLTQVMTRFWLAQLNYSFGSSQGYQTDPYRIISVVDPVTGGPQQYLYESRPNSRTRHSVYFGNKLALGPTVADISARYYHDSWGVSSITAEVSERVPILAELYVEPMGRYYHQSAANFFQNYLVGGQALPQYASSDSRLARFNARTFGLKIGYKVVTDGELYLVGEDYKQTGTQHPASAIGDLANQNLFSGISAKSVVLGFRYTFR